MVCTLCVEDKDETEFYFRSPGVRRKDCKSCVGERNKSHYEKTYGKDSHRSKPVLGRRKHYAPLLQEQEGRCAICGKHEDELTRKLHVDHCHETGVIRGLLCGACNMGLGQFRDSIDNMKNAIAYLEQFKVVI